MPLSNPLLAAFSHYQPFTYQVASHLVGEGIASADSSLRELHDRLLNTRETLARLTRPDESRAQAMTRFHQGVTAGLEASQIPPFLTECAAVFTQPRAFRDFIAKFMIHSGHLVFAPIAHVEHQELIVRFIMTFEPLLLSAYDDYNPVGHMMNGFDDIKRNRKKLRGKEEAYAADFYLILVASALYEPEKIAENFKASLFDHETDVVQLIKDLEAGPTLETLLDINDLAEAGKMDDDDRADAAVIKALADSDADVREQAVFFLRERRCLNAAEALIEVSQTDPDERVRKTALFALEVIKDPSRKTSARDLDKLISLAIKSSR